MNEDEEIINELQKKYLANDANGISCEGDNFMIIEGKLPILLSAPHAVKHFRSGKEKQDDTSTGPLVEIICQKCGTYGIIRTFNKMDDPNFDDTGLGLKYKNTIVELVKEKEIKYLLDIHACSDEHGFDINIGTNDGKNINNDNFLEIIKNEFEKIGKVEVDKMFKASGENTVCNYVHRNAGISCFQIEISASLRWKTKDLLKVIDVLKKITGLIIQNL